MLVKKCAFAFRTVILGTVEKILDLGWRNIEDGIREPIASRRVWPSSGLRVKG